MSAIRIEWLHDDVDCETCGGNYAEGARVWIDEKLALDLTPSAHCFNGDSYDMSEVFERTLRHLGHEVVA